MTVRGRGEFFVFGVLTAFIAALTSGLPSLFVIVPAFVGDTFLGPATEELVRTTAFIIHLRYGHVSATGIRAPIVFWGIGYGAVELVPRVFSIFHFSVSRVANSEDVTLSFLVPLSPFIMHILLTIIAASLVPARRAFTAFAICFTIHAIHNTYVVWIWPLVDASLPTRFAEITLRLLALLLATIAVGKVVGRPPLPSVASATGRAESQRSIT
jgi:hypothetical protein